MPKKKSPKVEKRAQAILGMVDIDKQFAKFVASTREYLDMMEGIQIDKAPEAQKRVQYLPRFCQHLLDMSYDAGLLILADTIKQEHNDTVDTVIGEFVLRNLQKADKNYENVAYNIRQTIHQHIPYLKDEELYPIIYQNIEQIIAMREEEGWTEEQMTQLKKELTEPDQNDLPRQASVKKALRNSFFPPVSDGEIARSYNPYRYIEYIAYGDRENKLDQNDLIKLPITSLYMDALDHIFLEHNGQPKENVRMENYMFLGQALQAMYEIDATITIDILSQILMKEFSFENKEYLPVVLSDFVQQRAQYEYEEGTMDKADYECLIELTSSFLDQIDHQTRYNASLVNLYGIVMHKSIESNNMSQLELNKTEITLLSCMKNDTPDQKEAKAYIQKEYMISISPQKPKP